MSGHKGSKALAFAGLLLLCLLWAIDSIRADLFSPSTARALPQFQRQALQFASLAFAAGMFARIGKAIWPRGQSLRDYALVGLGMFFAPAMLIYVSRDWISELTRVALFSLAPVFALVFEPHLGRGVDLRQSALVAALIAVVGTLCVFPVYVPTSVEAGGAFCVVIVAVACVAAANCRAVYVVMASPSRSLAPMITVAGGAAAVGFTLTSSLSEHAIWSWDAFRAELPWSAALEWPALLLLFWLMPRMGATQMTTRFLIAPLITNLIAIVALRPVVNLRAGLGLLLIAIGAGWLLFADKNELPQEEALHPPNLR
jgi:drug/metabolite transporter (DMT)-like permease